MWRHQQPSHASYVGHQPPADAPQFECQACCETWDAKRGDVLSQQRCSKCGSDDVRVLD